MSIGVFIFILILILPVVIVVSLITNLAQYFRFKVRNQNMRQLAEDFDLTFNSGLPTFFRFAFSTIYKDFRINFVEGSINGHYVLINDTYWPSIANLFLRYRRQTIIEVDGKNIKGDLKSFSLGNVFYLTTMSELRKFLAQLKSE